MTLGVYDRLFDTVLARTDPEWAHHAAFRAIRLAAPPLTWARRLGELGPVARRIGRRGEVRAMGLTFPHVLGLAAGFDKNAVGIDALAALGFGHVEIGTVTAEPQPGNPKPRLFRLPADRAIVNRMGFNNDGAEVVARRLAARAATNPPSSKHHEAQVDAPRGPGRVVLGVNIGKTKVVADDDQAAVQADYEKSAGLLAPYADYLVVNVSSPNTPGLRALQSVERLDPLLRAVRTRADGAAGRRVPLLVKIAPDLADDDVLAVADLALAQRLEGIIATNTTLSRDGLVSDAATVAEVGAGGLSGRPLTGRSLDVLRLLHGRVGDAVTLVSVGGITTTDDARSRLDAGATLLQAYTGFVYGGPRWPSRLVRELG